MDYRYLIVGGGMAADAAARELRRADPDGNVLLVSAEQDAPYRRPPLSKGLWNGADPAKIFLRTERSGAELLLRDPAVKLDVSGQTIGLASGKEIGYEKLLLATGARARTLPSLPVGGPVVAYRNLQDYKEAQVRGGPGRRVLVVGGGFIGAEIAAGLQRHGAEVHMVFQEEAISALRFPRDLATAITDDYKSRGVHIHAASSIEHATVTEREVAIELTNGFAATFSLVVVGVGARPNDELAREAGLEVENGVVLDEYLRARRSSDGTDDVPAAVDDIGVFAAGDVASFPWPRPFKRGRIEHEDNAVTMGAHAGRNMAASVTGVVEAQGQTRPQLARFTHLPFFYSDLFDNGYEAVGTLDSRLETVSDWRQPFKEGVVYYLDAGILVGVLLWNTWGQVDEARELLQGGNVVGVDALLGRLPR